ncbi:MAG TPA: hypothetical protein VIK30_00160 [Polyangia bacterium]
MEPGTPVAPVARRTRGALAAASPARPGLRAPPERRLARAGTTEARQAAAWLALRATGARLALPVVAGPTMAVTQAAEAAAVERRAVAQAARPAPRAEQQAARPVPRAAQQARPERQVPRAERPAARPVPRAERAARVAR